ncbi:MAG: hypothetical protein ACR9NN_25120 [Nostochopsis sp.]
MIIPPDDMTWAMNQKPSVNQFWQECWLSDPYGSRWMPLNTKLTGKTLKLAKAAIRKAGLFEFKTEMRMLEGKRYYETLVINLHGSRRYEFWSSGGVENYPTSDSPPEGDDRDPKQVSHNHSFGVVATLGGVIANPTNNNETQSQQDFQQASVTSQQLLSNSSKEILSSSTLDADGDAPHGGASPSAVVEQEQEQEQERETQTQTQTVTSFEDIKKKNPFLTKSKNPMHLALQPPRRQYKPSGDIQAIRRHFDLIYQQQQ